MGMFAGKKGVIMGVANDHSLAWAIAKKLHAEGAELAFNHLPDTEGRNRMERRVKNLTDTINAKLVAPCDVSSDQDVTDFFKQVQVQLGTIDFLVHSIAFANVEDIRRPTYEVSRDGFKQAMDISVYSFIATSRAAAELMKQGGSMMAMTYYGGEKVIPGYNMMGVCKAALDRTVGYLAFELGSRGIRVNALSAGPVRTLASSAVGDFQQMLKVNAKLAPLGRNITPEEVANSAAFLLSDLSAGTTGELFHVDAGFNIMGSFSKDVLQSLLT